MPPSSALYSSAQARRPDIRDVVEWDVASWSKAIAFWQRHALLGPAPQRCLEIGARSGGLSLWLASQGHRVVCSDLQATESRARPLIARAGLEEYVSFADIDATAIPYSEYFDAIAFKSVLGAVAAGGSFARQERAIASMFDALKPGGRLLFAENLVGSALHRYFRQLFVPWVRTWRYVTIEEMLRLLAPFKKVDYAVSGVFASFGRGETQRRVLASLDDLVANRLAPKSWKYIIYGVAVK
jgi:SAM-dependent methyltransferase